MTLVLVLLAVVNAFAQETDTQRLAEGLRETRGQVQLTVPQFRRIQQDLLAWSDSRIQQGRSVDELNRELEMAGLLTTGRRGPEDDIYQPYAGYLGAITTGAVDGAPDLWLLNISVGMTCSFDQTAVVYQRSPLKRIGWIHYTDTNGQLAWGIVSIAAGPLNRGERALAATLMHRWCTSAWGSIQARIWKMDSNTLRPVFIRQISVRRDEPTTVEVVGDTVTFRYGRGTFDFNGFFIQPAIQRFRIDGYRAERIAPFAVTMLGFIDYWLASDEPPVRERAEIAAWMKGGNDFPGVLRITRCPGSPRLWQVVVGRKTSDERRVLVIEENGAENLRMVAVRLAPSRACPEVDVADMGRELPF